MKLPTTPHPTHDPLCLGRPLAPILRPGRTLSALDLENLNCGPDSSNYQPVARGWNQLLPPQPPDLRICGTDVTGTFAARDAFPDARLVAGRGPDGADRALFAALDDDHIPDRFDTIVIGSGDHCFAPALRRLRDAGMFTVAVAVRSMARELAAVAHRSIVLPRGTFR